MKMARSYLLRNLPRWLAGGLRKVLGWGPASKGGPLCPAREVANEGRS
jgi:hypothetical protein